MADFEAYRGDTDVARSGKLWFKQEGQKVFIDLTGKTIVGWIITPDAPDIELVGLPDPDQVAHKGLFAFILNLEADMNTGLYDVEWHVTSGSTIETWGGDTLFVLAREAP